MTAAVRTFLPWYRAGFATALTGAPPPGATRAAVPAGVRLRHEPARGRLAVPLALAGPGDVVGLDGREVRRTEPFDGCADFEPAYFPYVELASPDLPWRFSPEGPASSPLPVPAGEADGGGVQQRVRPWLALAVVPTDRSTLAAAGGGPAVLRCDAGQLPDPAEAWAWAHVQVTHAPDQPLADALAFPGAALARLVCPRRLDPGVGYRAVLVPTFAAGRTALVGGPDPAEPLGPAWGAGGDVELPAYLHWTFRTGPEGSFEALVRRLRPRPVPAGAGGRTIATGAPNWGAHAASDDAEVVMQGALRPIGVTEPPADDAVLAESLRAAVSRGGAELELRPPLYGQDYRRGLAALPAGTGGWLAELNTDPRRRATAGLAAWAVAVHQEDLVDAAWQQLAADRATGGRRQVDRALADAVTGALADRHLGGPLGPPALGTLARQLRAGGPLAANAPRIAGADPTAAGLTVAGPAGPAGAVAAGDPASATETETGDQADPGAFAPHYDQPAYELLRALAPEWLLPAVGDLPVDSVALAQTNGAFVESYLVGLNHTLARELVWRRFPLRADGTFFDRFWATTGDTPGAVLPPVAGWGPDDRLGSHTIAEDQLVLVVRGALLQRFPGAAVYLSRTDAGGAEQQLLPAFSGRIGPDCVFLGFALTAGDALAAGTGGASGWSVVVQEALGHARFGIDDAPPDGTTTPLASWQDLDAAHPQIAGHLHVPVAGALSGVLRPLAAGSAATAVWGLDAAQQAVIVQQPAFRVRIPVGLWLRTPQPPTP